jgi:ankyrin repeat protein
MVSLKVVQYLVEQFPDAIKMADKAGNFPFHRACGKGAASLEVVQYLVEQWPDAVRVAGADERLPLDTACWSRGTVSLEVLQFLVEQCPDAVKTTRPGNGNYLPFHAICTNDNAPLDAVRFLLEQWPDAIKLRSWGGRLPLHLICSREMYQRGVVSFWSNNGPMPPRPTRRITPCMLRNDIVARSCPCLVMRPDASK